MPFENKGTLKKAHDKYSTWNSQIRHSQNMVRDKNGTLCAVQKNSHRLFGKELTDF